MRDFLICRLAALGLGLAFLSSTGRADPSMTSRPFGHDAHGAPVTLYTLTNAHGVSVSVMDYGATITSIRTPDAKGKLDDIVLGFDNAGEYIKHKDFFGATVGRYAGRIGHARFSIGQTPYQLAANSGANNCHGGPRGFDKQIWKFEPVDSDTPALRFSLLSPDGDQAFPGNLFVSVTFQLNDDNELRITYQATTDKTTIINLTNHSYFNLAGAGHGNVLDQLLTIHADQITTLDASNIPTGAFTDVAGTPWDFRQPVAIGARIREVVSGRLPGYDHNYVLKKGFFSKSAEGAVAEDPASGRTMTMSTDQPGVQLYTGNYLANVKGRDGKTYPAWGGFCLETQHYPDSPNHDNFPSTLLRPGDAFKSTTVYRFGTK